MKGIFYGVGVGPGGADMMTVQALKVIEGSDVIAVPAQEAGRSTAWKILLKAYPKAESLPVLPLGFPMTRDAGELARCHQSAAKRWKNSWSAADRSLLSASAIPAFIRHIPTRPILCGPTGTRAAP